MREPALLADHIGQRMDEILAVWKAAVARDGDVPEAERLTYVEFIDRVPELLELLSERLRGQPSDTATESRKHGRLRWKQGYDIAEIVVEFGHLRTALLRATADYARERGWDISRFESVCEIIHDVLDESVAGSVRQFQKDSHQETQTALAESKTRQDALEGAWIAAKTEQSKLRAVLRNLPAAVWVIDVEGNVIGANNEAERLQSFFEVAPSEPINVRRFVVEGLVLRPDGSPCPHDDLPLLRALRGETVDQEEFLWVVAGERKSVLINAAPLSDAGGALVGAVGVAQDISEQKRLQADLAVSEARFRSIAEQSPVMIWRTDAAGMCDYVNQTWCEFRGGTVNDHLGARWLDGIHPDDADRCRARIREALERLEPFEMAYRLLRHDAQYRWLSNRGTPYADAGGTILGFLGSCLDITDRIELETALEEQRSLAEESSRHKSRLVSSLSHDARTPLTAVVLAAQLLEVHCVDEQDAEVKECLRTIRHSVKNVLDLLNDLLDLSKIDAGASPVEVSRFPISPTLVECLANIENQARAKGLSVRLDPDGLEGTVFETDRSKLKQIVGNLLSNALRYTEEGEIRLFCERNEDAIRISVADTGIGIDPSDQSRIFDEFATLDYSRRQAGEGTGLGLAICRRLANLLKGEIALKSAPGVGSTFSLVLPASVLSRQEQVSAATLAAIDSPATGAILVVEDHLDSRLTLAKVLRRLGYRVIDAGNGRDALALARQEENLIAVLMDVNMPIMDGIEATLQLRADPRFQDLPIFALTGDVTLVNRHRIGEAGVDGYLEKPVTIDVLKQALGSLKDRARG
jgi:PAS domain S-box-containing protein